MNFFESKQHRLFFDGAMGTMLQALGLKPGEATANWNLSHPELVQQVHEDYLKAGCNIISANTFTANPVNFPAEGQAALLVEKGVAIAKKAAAGYPGALVALDVGPLGRLMEPFGGMSFDFAYHAFQTMMTAGEKAGADFILMETMTDLAEVKAAVLAAKENTALPVAVTVTFHNNQRMLTGGDLYAAIVMLEGLGVDAVGFNCSLGPAEMAKLLEQAAAVTTLPLICTPNAGLPVFEDGKAVYQITPEEYAEAMYQMAQKGAFLLGGCCGTTPAHMKAMINRCKELPLPELKNKNLTAASSSKGAVYFEKPLLVGSRLNPLENQQYRQALLEEDYDFLQEEADAQLEEGADLLSVGAWMENIEEKDVLPQAVSALQMTAGVPLVISAKDSGSLEQAVRRYVGSPIVTAVADASMEAVFAIAKKYGGLVICLPFSGDGVPGSAKERAAIAEKMIAAAEKQGLSKNRLLFDLLFAADDADGLHQALDTVEQLQAMGVKIAVGTANVVGGFSVHQRIGKLFGDALLPEAISCFFADPAEKNF